MEKPKITFAHHFCRLGQDSEFFLWNPIKEEVIPSYNFFPKREDSTLLGAKQVNILNVPQHPEDCVRHKPLKEKYNHHPLIYTDGKIIRAFRDGLAVEVNTPPTTCRAFLANGVRYALLLSEPWSRSSKARTYTSRPWVSITQKMIDAFPEDLRVLGCSPSLDAYEEREKTVTVDPLKTYFRTSGSHLHMSFQRVEGPPAEHWAPFIRLADVLMGVPFAYIFNDSLEFKRRKLYGQAGEFRFQHYSKNPANPVNGLEYRVLSSRLWNHPGVSSFFTGAWKYFLGNSSACNQMWEEYDMAWQDTIRQAINEGDPKAQDEAMKMSFKLFYAAMNKRSPSGWNGIIDPYTFNLPMTEEHFLSFFKDLRERNKLGQFPDAGIYNNLSFGDHHIGFNDYRKNAWLTPLAS